MSTRRVPLTVEQHRQCAERWYQIQDHVLAIMHMVDKACRVTHRAPILVRRVDGSLKELKAVLDGLYPDWATPYYARGRTDRPTEQQLGDAEAKR